MAVSAPMSLCILIPLYIWAIVDYATSYMALIWLSYGFDMALIGSRGKSDGVDSAPVPGIFGRIKIHPYKIGRAYGSLYD